MSSTVEFHRRPRWWLLPLLVGACGTAAGPGTDGGTCATLGPRPRPGATVTLAVPMRDCVHLSTNVTLPEGEGPWPVVLIRTPYGKDTSSILDVGALERAFTPYGYAVVQQDTRGRFASEGTFTPLVAEADDTYDTLAWLERQPWFDGRVAAWGASYLGLTALLAAYRRPDLVRAAWIGVIRSDLYGVAYEHGALRADVSGLWALAMARRDSVVLPSEELMRKALLDFPLAEADLRTVGPVAFDDLFFEHPLRDAFWTQDLDPERWARLPVPLYLVTGWFDFMVDGTLADWEARERAANPAARHLVVGPWTHLMGVRYGNHEYPFREPGAFFFLFDETIAFFDRYVKGRTGRFQAPPVRWYDGGEQRWCSALRLWPEERSAWRLYGAPISGDVGCGAQHPLAGTAPSATTTLAYPYDPRDVIEIRGGSLLHATRSGMRRALTTCTRADLVRFLSPPVSTPIEIAGAPRVHLRFATDVSDTSIVARLLLVTPEGERYNLREGAILLSHRDGDDRFAPYTPGTWVDVEWSLPRLRWTLQPGDRLELVLAGSAFPFVVPHPNRGGERWLFATEPVTATHRLWFGPTTDATTWLELPVAAPSCQPTPLRP